MSGGTARRALQAFLTVLGGVALVAGVLSMLFGVGLVPGHNAVTPNVDTELRFFSAWYAAAGVVVLRTVPKVDAAGATIRGVAVAFFLGGCARVVSLIVVGRPDHFLVVLMVIELALPFVVVPWQRSVARGATGAGC